MQSAPSTSSSSSSSTQYTQNAKPPNNPITTTTPQKEELPDKPPKVRGHCCLYFVAGLVRIICAIAGLAELGYGGWILYQEKTYKGFSSDSLLNAVQGTFLVLAGVAILFAELRNRWTATRAVKMFLFLESWGGRGVFYLIVGALNVPIKVKVWNISYASGLEFGGLVALSGILSISLFPFFFNLDRRREDVLQIWEAKKAEFEGVIVDDDNKPRDLNSGRTMFDPKLANLGNNVPIDIDAEEA